MARLLLVENNKDLLGVIFRSMPGHEIQTAETFDQAIDYLKKMVFFDVAVVDLNLVDSPAYNGFDGLGGEFLYRLRSGYSPTRRIAMTAYPPAAVREIFDQYVLDDLLIKENMQLHDVREAVERSLARAMDVIPLELRAHWTELRTQLRRWRDDRRSQFDDQVTTLQYDIRLAARSDDTDDAARQALADLEMQGTVLDQDYLMLEKMLAEVRCAEDSEKAEREIRVVQGRFAG
jgi:CheY-like chemotaxis protein